MSDESLLSVRNLEKFYPVRSGLLRRKTGEIKAVNDISFEVKHGETFGLVGESGCGKSTTATTVLQLEKPTGGTVYFDGEDVTEYTATERKEFRRRAGIVFQDPNTAFDPRMTVGESLAEPLAIHGLRDSKRQEAIVADLLERVGLSAADADRHPREFSDGQKQRIALARALILDPDLLVADEPVSALDVSIQAEILSLLSELKEDFELSMLLISHDLAVVQQVCDRVGVMYLGEIVEKGPTDALFDDPQHPYTEALLASIPDPDPRRRGSAIELTGDVPDPSNPPSGCSFHPRCPRVIPPPEYDFDDGVFRTVLDFRLALEDQEFDEDFATIDDLREAGDLPMTLQDDDAESVLRDALEAVVADRREDAIDRLGTAFETVCEREDPELLETDAGRPAACHLHTQSGVEFGD